MSVRIYGYYGHNRTEFSIDINKDRGERIHCRDNTIKENVKSWWMQDETRNKNLTHRRNHSVP